MSTLSILVGFSLIQINDWLIDWLPIGRVCFVFLVYFLLFVLSCQ